MDDACALCRSPDFRFVAAVAPLSAPCPLPPPHTHQTDGSTYAYMRSVLCILINIAWCVWMVLALNGLGEFSGGEAAGSLGLSNASS